MARLYIIILVLPMVLQTGLCSAAATDETAEGGQPTSVKSYLGNYAVIAPDAEIASLYAKLAEDIRKRVANVLGDNREYGALTYVTILPVAGKEDADEEWNVTALHGMAKKDFGTMPKSRLESTLKLCVVYYYLLDAAAAAAAENSAKILESQLPLWVCAAVMENLTQENREAYRNFISPVAGQNKHMPFEKLFVHDGKFKNEQERALYFHECGSLLDYIISLPNGKKSLLEAIRELWKRSDLAVSLMWQFKSDFASVGDLENKWIEFVEKRPEKVFDFRRLSLEETRARLLEILAVEIKYLDKKTIVEKTEVTDFEGLMNHKNATTRLNIALNKIALIQDLKLRAPKEYQEVLGEYLLSLKAIVDGEKKQFKKHYKKANEFLKTLGER